MLLRYAGLLLFDILVLSNSAQARKEVKMKLVKVFAIPIIFNRSGTPLEYRVIFCDKVDKRTREYKRNAKYLVHPFTMLQVLGQPNIQVKFYNPANHDIFRVIAKDGETAYKISKIIRGVYD